MLIFRLHTTAEDVAINFCKSVSNQVESGVVHFLILCRNHYLKANVIIAWWFDLAYCSNTSLSAAGPEMRQTSYLDFWRFGRASWKYYSYPINYFEKWWQISCTAKSLKTCKCIF